MSNIHVNIPLIDNHYVVNKRDRKGGWTYVVLSDMPTHQKNSLGFIRVRGFIDTYEIKQFNLLPLKEDSMLLPIKTAIRKQIGKKEGDTVHVILFSDDSAVVTPDDIMVCLLESPKAHSFFLSLSDSNQKHYIDWIEESKRLETKVGRISKTMERLENGLKFYDW